MAAVGTPTTKFALHRGSLGAWIGGAVGYAVGNSVWLYTKGEDVEQRESALMVATVSCNAMAIMARIKAQERGETKGKEVEKGSGRASGPG